MFIITNLNIQLNLALLWRNGQRCVGESAFLWAIFMLIHITLVPCQLSAQSSEEQKAYEQQQLTRVSSSKTEWQKLVEGTNFSETIEKEPEKKQNTNNRPDITLPSPPSKMVMTVIYIAAAIFLLVFLAYIITGGFKNIQSSTNTKIKVTEENLEENLMEANPDDFLPPAIQRNDYRQALRLRYLSIIKRLAETDRIRWRKEKTNNNYLTEMTGSPLSSDFTKVTRIYEKVWFGEWNQPFEEQDFEQNRIPFDQLLTAIG